MTITKNETSVKTNLLSKADTEMYLDAYALEINGLKFEGAEFEKDYKSHGWTVDDLDDVDDESDYDIENVIKTKVVNGESLMGLDTGCDRFDLYFLKDSNGLDILDTIAEWVDGMPAIEGLINEYGYCNREAVTGRRHGPVLYGFGDAVKYANTDDAPDNPPDWSIETLIESARYHNCETNVGIVIENINLKVEHKKKFMSLMYDAVQQFDEDYDNEDEFTDWLKTNGGDELMSYIEGYGINLDAEYMFGDYVTLCDHIDFSDNEEMYTALYLDIYRGYKFGGFGATQVLSEVYEPGKSVFIDRFVDTTSPTLVDTGRKGAPWFHAYGLKMPKNKI